MKSRLDQTMEESMINRWSPCSHFGVSSWDHNPCMILCIGGVTHIYQILPLAHKCYIHILWNQSARVASSFTLFSVTYTITGRMVLARSIWSLCHSQTIPDLIKTYCHRLRLIQKNNKSAAISHIRLVSDVKYVFQEYNNVPTHLLFLADNCLYFTC